MRTAVAPAAAPLAGGLQRSQLAVLCKQVHMLSTHEQFRQTPTARCMLCSFNKKEEEFASKEEWNDYLETREEYSARPRLPGFAHFSLHAARVCARTSRWYAK